MPIIRIQGEEQRLKGIVYEFDTDVPPIGQGGMGTVYRGWQLNTYGQSRQVAIKKLHDGVPYHVIERARREASVQLRNDNLVEMLGFIETNEYDEFGTSIRRYYVISEYLHGVSLSKLITGKINDYEGKPIPYAAKLKGMYDNARYQFAIMVTRSILSGLMALHDSGFIHRDIDPSNIMVTEDGHIKLIDFGISRRFPAAVNANLTQDGQFIGKPGYAAPELVLGSIDSQDPRTDIYALGIMLFELITGHLPFTGDTATVLNKQLKNPLPLNEIKQKEIRDIIKKATRKEREDRFSTAAEFRVSLDKLTGQKLVESNSNKRLIISAASVACALIISGLIVWSFLKTPSENEITKENTQLLANQDNEKYVSNAVDIQKYDQAVNLLKNAATAQNGLNTLLELSKSENPEIKFNSLFLLSRLYFKSEEPSDVNDINDSVRAMQSNLGSAIQIDNQLAHEYLLKAVDTNPEDYRALYELGCNFKAPLMRRGAQKDFSKAKEYLNRAEELARKAGDNNYLEKIQKRK